MTQMAQRNKQLRITDGFGLNRPKATASMAIMKPLFRKMLRKHNGFLAMVLSLALIISGSLNLIHDQLLDHHHDSDCAMYMVDGKTPVAAPQANCSAIKQQVVDQPYTPVSLVLSQFEKHAPRAPPANL
jgi:hypothetical protein